MENLKILSWLFGNSSVDVYGPGAAAGAGFVAGFGIGVGHGLGYALYSGFGYGPCDGRGYEYGSGYGRGFGGGDGSIFGSGKGCGNKSGISFFCGYNVFVIDKIQTIITGVHGALAKGYILNTDLTLDACYIVKGSGYFAHGETVKKANDALRKKILENIDEDEAIEKFIEIFKPYKKYQCSDYYEWHHHLTGSCEMGRKSFMKNHDISMEDEITVEEFFSLTENEFGSEVIKNLKKRYLECYH